jgi:hypothetical protein
MPGKAVAIFILYRLREQMPEMVQPVTTDSALLSAGKRLWKRLACHLPLAALAIEFVWIFLLFMALVFSVGDTPYVNTPDKSHFFNWLSSGPAPVGVLFGVIGILLRFRLRS